MSRKLIICGLLLLLVGSGGLGWVAMEREQLRVAAGVGKTTYMGQEGNYVEQGGEGMYQPGGGETTGDAADYDDYVRGKTESQLRQEQQARLKADLPKLAAGMADEQASGDLLYGAGWRQAVSEYKARQELHSLVLTASLVTAGFGLVGLVAGMVVFCVRAWGRCRQRGSRGVAQKSDKLRDQEPDKVSADETGVAGEVFEGQERLGWGPGGRLVDKVVGDSGSSFGSGKSAGAWGKVSGAVKSRFSADMFGKRTEGELTDIFAEAGAAIEEKAGAVGLLEPESGEVDLEVKTQEAEVADDIAQVSECGQEEIVDICEGDDAAQVRDKLTSFAANVNWPVTEDSLSLGGTLKDLAQQVSAIRQYAAEQQERVTKLQDGYDWNIIRNFCLRIIRCIDNLESRIKRLEKSGVDTSDLEEVRDELIFSLESSGVEQYEAELYSDYRGQEKRFEAVKEKEHCDDASLFGKIGKVVRPGYQYIIDEDNVKIVRAAQVRLLG